MIKTCFEPLRALGEAEFEAACRAELLSSRLPDKPVGPQAQDEHPESLHEWIQLLDKTQKGYVSKQDIVQAAHACGLEPTPQEMSTVTSISSPLLRASSSLELFGDLGCPFDIAKERLSYYRAEKVQLRPDGFVYMPQRRYYWLRFLSYLVPFASVLLQHKTAARSTPEEKSMWAALLIMGYTTTIMSFFMMAQIALAAGGLTSTITLTEILTIQASLVGVVWGTEVSRETSISLEGRIVDERMRASVPHVRYSSITLTNGKEVKGLDVLWFLAKSCSGTTGAQSAWAILDNVVKAPCLNWFIRQKLGERGRRRSSAAEADLVLVRAGHAETDYERLNVYKLKAANMGGWGVALVFASVGTVTRALRGEPTMFTGENSYDVLAEAFSTLLSF